MHKLFPCILLVVTLSGCGPFVAGTWENDPKNWERAFGTEPPPKGVSLLNSWCWRSPHWTAEFAWFFELELDEATKQELLHNPELKRITLQTEAKLDARLFNPMPDWFTPIPLSDYVILEATYESDFLIFIHKTSGRSWWSGYSL